MVVRRHLPRNVGYVQNFLPFRDLPYVYLDLRDRFERLTPVIFYYTR